MTENQNGQKEQFSGTIENMGILDLTKIKSLDKIKNITSIKNVGTILVPEPLMDEIMNIPMQNIGGMVPIPDGENVRVRSGQITMSGDAIARSNEDLILVVAGQLIIDSKFDKVGYKKLQIMGQLFAPKECQSLLEEKIDRLTGQAVYYKTGAKPKIFTGAMEFSREFFEFIDEPITLILSGEFTITEEIPVELIKEKIADIVVAGEVKAPKKIVSIFQSLASSVMGEIKVYDEDTKENTGD